MAHNQETNRYRGISEEQRADFLHMLNNGASLDEAADVAGVSAASLSAASAHDGELRAALDGLPREAQKAARMGDYLAALTRTAGNTGQARDLAGVSRKTLENYRQAHPEFRHAEEAVVQWLADTCGPSARRVNALSGERIARAARVMEEGGSVSEAARTIKCSQSALRYAARRSPRLATAIEQAAEKWRNTGRASGLDSEKVQVLRDLWADPEYTRKSIATKLGVTVETVYRWAEKLELPLQQIRKTYEAFGGTYTAAELARLPQCTVHQRTVYQRLDSGWPPEEAVTVPAHSSR